MVVYYSSQFSVSVFSVYVVDLVDPLEIDAMFSFSVVGFFYCNLWSFFLGVRSLVFVGVGMDEREIKQEIDIKEPHFSALLLLTVVVVVVAHVESSDVIDLILSRNGCCCCCFLGYSCCSSSSRIQFDVVLFVWL
mmetsp:Transcript_29285/g.70568  ORF Transcript_29285/g.70568 Transcript_29285/m.70568 type:complete len:135 (-) Transcript_29285:644-1048(-)